MKNPLWTILRTLGNSPAVKLTIFIPVVGYLVILNENVLQYLELSRVVYGTPSDQLSAMPALSTAHVTWQLLFVYFGLSIIALAATLYALKCPEIIKRFSSSIDYVAYAMGHTGDSYLAKAEGVLQAEPSVSKELDSLRRRLDKRVAMSDSPHDTEQSATIFFRDMLHLHFSMLNNSHRGLRVATLSFYCIGFAVLGVPATYTFYRVAILAVERVAVAFGL